jgi:NaMN:DMB phosphoribosyltransferase
MSESFDAYRDRFLSRHENNVTSVLSTVGDVVIAAGLGAAVATRRVQVGVIGVSVGTAIAAIAHLFPPGTLRDEVSSILRHPVWAARAEGERIFGRQR